ncbi:hypothetical protein [Promicromonospora iranensis]|uniref:Aminoglycoside phosphotransferase domain-containing protein n=1 Tax=Promicromonospora iranensis TaxID=1105144 RepID=A0ABU2CKM3_9MICO|nr:hypothetical protein [Promicromonospora iranensis]MDR7381889.1 hypothetical protein [Promicromonospora iranensis]
MSETMGGRVIGSAPMSGTEPAGTLEVLQTASGRSIVRAVGPEAPLTQDRMAAEAASVATLPDDVPMLPREWFVDEVLPGAGRWVVLGYRNEPIRPPHDPWDEADLAAAVELAIQIGSSEAPPDLPDTLDLIDSQAWATIAAMRPPGLSAFTPWLSDKIEHLAEIASYADEAMSGKNLVHGALSRESILITDHGWDATSAHAVDWFMPSRGASYLDVVLLLPHLRVDGAPPPEVVMDRHPLPDVDPEALTCAVTVTAGALVLESMRPPQPGLPHGRAVQREVAHAALEWLRTRLGG